MDAEKLLQAFTPEETQQLVEAIPADVLAGEVVRRGLELPQAAGALAAENAMKWLEAETLTPEIVKAGIEARLGWGVQAYNRMMGRLNANAEDGDEFKVTDEETITQEFAAWLTEDKIAYVKEAMEADPELGFTLTVTPNAPVEPKEVIALAEAFGEDQPYKTDVWGEIYGKYDEQQISGYVNDGTHVKFALIPKKLTPELSGRVVDQRKKLKTMQAEHPFVRVQTVLEDVACAEVIRIEAREQGKELKGDGTGDLTYSRHFDLPEKRLGRDDDVPDSIVSGGGQFVFGNSWTEVGDAGRAVVG